MKIQKIVETLEATVISGQGNLGEINIKGACSADLMSDVLYYYAPDSLLITGLVKPQVVRTAEIVGIRIIVFIQNKKPDNETIELAKQKKIPLLVTPLCMYTASGRLFQAGLPSIQKIKK